MEIRVLKYFITVAQEQSFSKAAKVLNISQPALSKQIKDLEEEYQITLFNRTTRSLSLTEEGQLFKVHVKEILNLVNKTEYYLKNTKKYISGDIYLGCSESEANRIVMKAIGKNQKNYPAIKFHLYSGNAQYVEEQLDQGIFDLGIVTDPADLSKYDYLKLPTLDTWGVLMKKDSELAKLDTISPKDLLDKPMIISNQEMVKNGISGWLGGNQRALNVVTTYNLFYNAMLMCEENVGYVLTLKNLYNESDESSICFKPLHPPLTLRSHLVWKKYKVFPKAIEIFLEILNEEIKKSSS